jgi:uncharacterized protein YbbC (DUF1343 family)
MMSTRWENWVNLALGLWIFFIPWSYGGNIMGDNIRPVVWNFWISGAIVTLVSILALNQIKSWEEWTNFFAGIWLFFSPWIIDFSFQAVYFANAVIVGMAISIISGLALPIAIKAEKKLL